MAVTSPFACSAVTRRSLCSGDVRAKMSVRLTISRSSSSEACSSSVPVTAPLPFPMPISAPMALAVSAWSPVIILTRMPADWTALIASMASGRGGSRIPNRPTRMKPPESMSATDSDVSSAGLIAAASTRSPSAPSLSTSRSQYSRSRGAV